MEEEIDLNDFAVELARQEGGKSQVKIGDLKECIKLISMELFKDRNEGKMKLYHALVKNGEKQFKEVKL